MLQIHQHKMSCACGMHLHSCIFIWNAFPYAIHFHIKICFRMETNSIWKWTFIGNKFPHDYTLPYGNKFHIEWNAFNQKSLQQKDTFKWNLDSHMDSWFQMENSFLWTSNYIWKRNSICISIYILMSNNMMSNSISQGN